jgi:tRNA(Ile2) C34 agmatinyltransferase TiaS
MTTKTPKLCSKCNGPKIYDGYKNYHCKPCEYERAKKWREKNKEKIKLRNGTEYQREQQHHTIKEVMLIDPRKKRELLIG